MKIYLASPPNRPSKKRVQDFIKKLEIKTLWSYIYIITEKSTYTMFKRHIK